MSLTRQFPLLLLSLAMAAAGVGVWSVPASAATAAAPHIVAKPTHVMVNQQVALQGRGFAPDVSLTLLECSETHWIAPKNPCLSDNSITVHTTASGAFRARMKAEICPAASSPPQTERTCYIGVPHPTGVDTVQLVGAARIVVSWP